MIPESAYLNLISLPPALDRAGVAGLLAGLGIADDKSVHIRLGASPPSILALVPPETAERGAGAIRAAGGDAFVCTLNDVQALGPTIKVKRFWIGDDSWLHADLWREGEIAFSAKDVRLIVRATTGKRAAGFGGAIEMRDQAEAIGRAGAMVVGAALDVLICGPGCIDPYPWGTGSSVPAPPPGPTAITSEKLDLHHADGRVFQIDGDKFLFDHLGDQRGPSDKGNMDRTVELLRGLLPGAIVDDFFPLWRPPPNLSRFRLPKMTLNSDVPAFAFYSRWAALMYRHIAPDRLATPSA
jgi:hypothetical protein